MDPFSRLQYQAVAGSAGLPDRVDLSEEDDSGRGHWMGRALAVAGLAVVACTVVGCTTESARPVTTRSVSTRGMRTPMATSWTASAPSWARSKPTFTDFRSGLTSGTFPTTDRCAGCSCQRAT